MSAMPKTLQKMGATKLAQTFGQSASNAFNLSSVAGRAFIGGRIGLDDKASTPMRILGAGMAGHAALGGIGMARNKDFGMHFGATPKLINGAQAGMGHILGANNSAGVAP
jgi:hypothetical protein